ncbi:SRPBCC family protein [Micromonospora sp. Llam0]|uniref:SRPBCC family protein n=1 Tax=Micromonospora sp. Llam0 TaxID=2485143 RepID=UPI001F3893C6|nr:SRPBCC family protein [Micromonospora sp. Llam0]
MKYTNSIEIALPREEVAQLLADPTHIPKWLRGLAPRKGSSCTSTAKPSARGCGASYAIG